MSPEVSLLISKYYPSSLEGRGGDEVDGVRCLFRIELAITPERVRSAPNLGGDSHRPRREEESYRGAHFVRPAATLQHSWICPAPQDIVHK